VSLAGLLAAAAPSAAAAEMCSGGFVGGSTTVDTALGPVLAVPGRSIGPVSVGMTRRQISRVARPDGRRRRGELFRVNGLRVAVTWGHWGRARALFAASGKLVVAGVALADGPDRLRQAVPELEIAHCDPASDGPSEAHLTGTPGPGVTSFGWYPAPQIPRLFITYARMRR
jgi:hypothetical protein